MKKKVKERGLLGTVLHITDKKLIVRSGKLKVKKVINSIAVTEDKREIGKVYDIFGPVNRPYVGIRVFEGLKLKEGELKKLVHKKLYVL
jgi:rRNA processing protein Gar1